MRAVQVTELSGPDALHHADLPEPAADPGLVVVEVAAAGVAFPDLLLSQGRYQVKPPPPFVLGVEAAGVVRSAPEGSGLAAGDRVALFGMGTWAEVVAVPPELVVRLPEAMTFEQGAGYVMNYHTVHFALGRRGQLRAGETVLVHGAAGGVGTAGLQVAKAMGARTIAVVSTDEKAAVARDAGADEVVATDGWLAAVTELTGGRGVDVVLDPVGGDRLLDSLRSLSEEGRLLVVGFAEGSIPSIPANRLLLKNIAAVGVAWGAFVGSRPEVTREIAADLDRMAADGAVAPVVGRRFRLEQAADALRAIDDRSAVGKVVLTLRD